MNHNTSKAFRYLISIGHAEGISYLLLLGIAMPLKYMYDMPAAVRIVGSIHGILFVAFVLALINARMDMKLPIGKSILLFIASLLPFGTFFLARIINAR